MSSSKPSTKASDRSSHAKGDGSSADPRHDPARAARMKAQDRNVDDLDRRVTSIAMRHLDPKKIHPQHMREALSLHLKSVARDDPKALDSLSDDAFHSHADDLFRAAAAEHPTLAHAPPSTSTSRELKKKHGLDW